MSLEVEEKMSDIVIRVILSFAFTVIILWIIYNIIRSIIVVEETKETTPTTLGSVLVYTELAKKIEEGKAFSSSKRFELAGNGSVSILFNNKSDKEVKIVSVEIDTEANISIDIYDNVNVVSSGDKWDIRNLNLGSDYMTSVEIEDGGNYTVVTRVIHQTIGFGGIKNFATGSRSDVGEEVIIPPNQNIMLVVTNPTSNNINISVRFLFYES
mgnify:CR=1 FL=1